MLSAILDGATIVGNVIGGWTVLCIVCASVWAIFYGLQLLTEAVERWRLYQVKKEMRRLLEKEKESIERKWKRASLKAAAGSLSPSSSSSSSSPSSSSRSDGATDDSSDIAIASADVGASAYSYAPGRDERRVRVDHEGGDDEFAIRHLLGYTREVSVLSRRRAGANENLESIRKAKARLVSIAGVAGGVTRVVALFIVKMLIFPAALGFALDAATLGVFGATAAGRVVAVSLYPVSFGLFAHWEVGIAFMLVVTVMIMRLKETLHPAVLRNVVRTPDPRQVRRSLIL